MVLPFKNKKNFITSSRFPADRNSAAPSQAAGGRTVGSGWIWFILRLVRFFIVWATRGTNCCSLKYKNFVNIYRKLLDWISWVVKPKAQSVEVVCLSVATTYSCTKKVIYTLLL